MFRILTMAVVIAVLLSVTAAHPDDEPTAARDKASKQYKALIDEFEEEGGAREFAPRFIELAAQNPKSPVAVDALVWVVVHVRRGKDLHQAITRLTEDHLKSPRLVPACEKLPFRPSLASETLLREMRKKSPHKAVRAQAAFHLAIYLQRQLRLVALMHEEEDQERFAQFYGKDFAEHLQALDTSASLAEIEAIYEDVARSFAEVKIDDSTMGETAKLELYALRNLSVGRTAPEISGKDVDGKPFKLSDYRGKVILLDFWGHW